MGISGLFPDYSKSNRAVKCGISGKQISEIIHLPRTLDLKINERKLKFMACSIEDKFGNDYELDFFFFFMLTLS